MAADYPLLAASLNSFYDFSGKVVLVVGAGGGQLLDPACKPKKVIAIDRDRQALDQLEAKLEASGTQDSVEIVCASFEDLQSPGDVVYFEFCLHEMSDPTQALAHARTLAPNTVVFDHLPDSPWSFHAAEEAKVRRSHEAMERFGVRHRRNISVEQRFGNHEELLAKISPQGELAIERSQRFRQATNIVIPMTCGLALL